MYSGAWLLLHNVCEVIRVEPVLSPAGWDPAAGVNPEKRYPFYN